LREEEEGGRERERERGREREREFRAQGSGKTDLGQGMDEGSAWDTYVEEARRKKVEVSRVAEEGLGFRV
jgi:hypothetical protein